jgi:hypothetical protein
MLMTTHCWTAVLIAGAAWVPTVPAADPKPDLPTNTVTVLYRGKTHTLTGKEVEVIQQAALDLLESSCKEIGGPTDHGGVQQRYLRAKKRSYVLVTFARPVDVPNAGNNTTPVRVESMMIPFSPDLDPETIFVLPGKRGERAFTQFVNGPCDTIRESLVRVGIYPAEDK